MTKSVEDGKELVESDMHQLGFKSGDAKFYLRIANGYKPLNPIPSWMLKDSDNEVSRIWRVSSMRYLDNEDIFNDTRSQFSDWSDKTEKLYKTKDTFNRELMAMVIGLEARGIISGKHYPELWESQQIRLSNSLRYLYEIRDNISDINFEYTPDSLNLQRYDINILISKKSIDTDLTLENIISSIYRIILATGYVRTSDIVIAFDVNRKRAYDILREMVNYKMLHRVGNGGNTVYQIE